MTGTPLVRPGWRTDHDSTFLMPCAMHCVGDPLTIDDRWDFSKLEGSFGHGWQFWGDLNETLLELQIDDINFPGTPDLDARAPITDTIASQAWDIDCKGLLLYGLDPDHPNGAVSFILQSLKPLINFQREWTIGFRWGIRTNVTGNATIEWNHGNAVAQTYAANGFVNQKQNTLGDFTSWNGVCQQTLPLPAVMNSGSDADPMRCIEYILSVDPCQHRMRIYAQAVFPDITEDGSYVNWKQDESGVDAVTDNVWYQEISYEINRMNYQQGFNQDELGQKTGRDEPSGPGSAANAKRANLADFDGISHPPNLYQCLTKTDRFTITSASQASLLLSVLRISAEYMDSPNEARDYL